MTDKDGPPDYEIHRRITERKDQQISKLQETLEGVGGMMVLLGGVVTLCYLVWWTPKTAQNLGFWEAVVATLLGVYLYYVSKKA